jgi:hypothetical protein
MKHLNKLLFLLTLSVQIANAAKKTSFEDLNLIMTKIESSIGTIHFPISDPKTTNLIESMRTLLSEFTEIIRDLNKLSQTFFGEDLSSDYIEIVKIHLMKIIDGLDGDAEWDKGKDKYAKEIVDDILYKTHPLKKSFYNDFIFFQLVRLLPDIYNKFEEWSTSKNEEDEEDLTSDGKAVKLFLKTYSIKKDIFTLLINYHFKLSLGMLDSSFQDFIIRENNISGYYIDEVLVNSTDNIIQFIRDNRYYSDGIRKVRKNLKTKLASESSSNTDASKTN